MSQIATLPTAHQVDRPRRDVTPTDDAVPMLDTAKFEHMQRIANVMASTSMIPDALRKMKVGGQDVELSAGQVMANCFLVVNQAVRWGMDPFAVAQCVSIVHGKLCYEGKLVSAVLDAKLGLKLHHHLIGSSGDARRIYLSDRPFDEAVIARLEPGIRFTDRRIFDGSVAEWKTTGTGTPWSPKNFDRMLIYRGTRDWCRIYEPAIMLGVYTPDEMLDLSENARAERAREVNRPSLRDRLTVQAQEPAGRREGFGHEMITSELGARPEAQVETQEPIDEPIADRAEDTDDGIAIDPDAPAGQHELEIEAESRAADATGTKPNHDPKLRALLTECAAKFIEIAARDVDAKDRQDAIKAAIGPWKGELPDNHDDVKKIVDRSNAVVTGKMNVPTAVTMLAAELNLSEADIRPVAR